jgi:penicillin-binding protein 2
MVGMPAESRGLRLSVIGIVVFSLFVALVARLWYLQVVQKDDLAQVASADQIRTVPLPPMRGRILDRVGRVLADNDSTLNVTIDRKVIKNEPDRKALFERLAGPLKTTPDELEKRFESPKYSVYEALPLAEDVDESTAIFLKERREDYPGVEVVEGFVRKYRYAPLASQIIGYMGAISKDNQSPYTKKGYQLSDRVGVAGVEATYEDVLHGKPGYIRYAVDARNRVLGVVERVDPVPGNDVQLTVDLKLQQYTEQILLNGILEARSHRVSVTNADLRAQATGQTFQAPAGAVVIEDPNTGEVVGMASYPTFDNRWFIGDLPQSKYSALFPADSDRSPLTNRAISGGYTIGSTMKLFTSVASLQSGALSSPNEVYDDQGKYEIPECFDERVGCVFHNSGGLKPGRIDLQNAISMSSDDYFYRLGVSMFREISEKDVFQKTLYQFGFGAKTDVDLPFESSGRVPTAAVKKKLAEAGAISKQDGEGYFVGDNLQLAIGGGLFAASPLQLVNGYATFANGGDHLVPHVGLAVLAAGTPSKAPGIVDMTQAQPLQMIDKKVTSHIELDQSWRDAITRGLIGVTQKRTFPFGTAHRTFENYNFNAFPIAGKTGTAQSGNGEASNDSSLFVGYGPVRAGDVPQYTAGAIIEKGGFGADASAPVVKCIFEALSGQNKTPLAEPQQSDPLDTNSLQVATLPLLQDTNCLKINQGLAPVGGVSND